MTKKIRCIQINLQHNRTASAALPQVILDLNVDIVFIQEPYTMKKLVPNIPFGYSVRHALDNGALYGAILIIRNNLCSSSNIITNHSSDQVIGVELAKGLRICSIYCRASPTGISEVLNPVLSDSRPNIENQLICVDSNGHSPLRNSRW